LFALSILAQRLLSAGRVSTDGGIMKRLPVLLLLALVPLAAPAQHPLTYTHLVIFGDNYSDTLNTYNATETITTGYDSDGDPITLIDAYPSAAYGYQDGMFTNGLSYSGYESLYFGVWHLQLNTLLPGVPPAAAALGASPLPTGNTNYAWGSATTGTGTTSITFAGHLTASVHNMNQQIDDYLNAGYTPDAKSLYVLFGGLNDLLNDSSTASVTAAAANVTAEAKRLVDAGAVNLLIANVPGISANLNSPIDTAASQFRAQLATDLSALEAQYALAGTPVHITTLDLYSLYANIMAKPAAFGFTDVMDKANALSSNTDVDNYLNWDGVNPTTAGHHQIALAACTALTGTTTALTIDKPLATPAQPATLTATVSTSGTYGPQSSFTPTGTVTFYYPQTVLTTTTMVPLGTVPVVNGQASITTTGLPPNVYTVHAVYSGDTNFPTGCASNTQTFTVAVASVGFDFTFSPSAAYIGMEEGVALTLTPNAIGGFTGPVSFSCSSLPQFFSCDFTNNQTVQIVGGGTTYVSQLVIETKLGVKGQLQMPASPRGGATGGEIALASLLAAPLILLLRRGKTTTPRPALTRSTSLAPAAASASPTPITFTSPTPTTSE
jgi:phospholipase/lecithinase/hemolysin